MVRHAHVVNTIVDTLCLLVRQRPAGDVVAIVLDCACRPIQVRRLCARPIGHAVHGHAATALVLLSHAYWRLGLAAWGSL